ncbi:aquaporin-6-like [Lacerta agilis]|uniref:aquaporin-6-like n=1 Tax=Lacerta agilis TaxID=80427 RepID=UPI00141A3899|nr:aquaporin-6-like [Lacerta agilis]
MWRELQMVAFYRAVFAEFLATAIFVFFGLGSEMNWPEKPSVLQTAITFNLAAATAVQIAWHASGSHLNPAVSLAFLLGSRVSLVRAACYILAQMVGGIAGAAVLYAVTPEDIRGSLGTSTVRVNVSSGQAVSIELVLTLQLVLSYLVSTDSSRNKGSPAIMIGVSVALGHLIGHYYTTCSMNPAKSFGRSVVVGNFTKQWIFWVGPLAGAILAFVLYTFVLYHDPKTFAERLAILRGSYDAEPLEKSKDQPTDSVSLPMPSLVHRL